jgi:hypothetical protein
LSIKKPQTWGWYPRPKNVNQLGKTDLRRIADEAYASFPKHLITTKPIGERWWQRAKTQAVS